MERGISDLLEEGLTFKFTCVDFDLEILCHEGGIRKCNFLLGKLYSGEVILRLESLLCGEMLLFHLMCVFRKSEKLSKRAPCGHGPLGPFILPLFARLAKHFLELLMNCLFCEELGGEVMVGLGLLRLSFMGGTNLCLEGGVVVQKVLPLFMGMLGISLKEKDMSVENYRHLDEVVHSSINFLVRVWSLPTTLGLAWRAFAKLTVGCSNMLKNFLVLVILSFSSTFRSRQGLARRPLIYELSLIVD